MENDFDIDDIREEIQNMSREEKLEYLSDKSTEIQNQIDELDYQIEELNCQIDELDYQIEELNCQIDELDYQIEELNCQIDELDSVNSEIETLIDEIENKQMQDMIGEICNALDSICSDIHLVWNGNTLTTHLGDVTIYISYSRYDDMIEVSYRTLKHGLPYRELMKKMLAGAKFDGCFQFTYHIGDKSRKEVMTDIVTALAANKEKFEEIASK